VSMAGRDMFTVRFPDGLRDRIKEAAKASKRSMNSEIIFQLEHFYSSGAATTGDSLATDPAVASNSAALAGGTHQQ